MFRSSKLIAVFLIFLLLPIAHAIEQDITVDSFEFGNTYYLYVKNPEGKNITIQVLNEKKNVVDEYMSNDTTVKYTFNQSGTWQLILSVNGITYDTYYFGLGSIIDTGFKTTLLYAFKGDLSLVALIALMGITVFAVSIGRYAGLPIFLIALGFFAYHNYLPSWLTYLVVLASAILFAIAIYRLVGVRG